MTRALYSLLFYLCLPLVLLRLAWRSLGEPEYRRRWRERFARAEFSWSDAPVWIHSVSAGETIAVVPLIRALKQRHPELPLLVTTMTPTGSERVNALLRESVEHCYVPYDLPHVVRRFLGRNAPRMLILTDTELWPNIIHQCARREIPVVQVNARLSARSARRYGRIASLTRAMLRSMTHVAVQSNSQGERFLALGLPEERLSVTGSIKFDLSLPEDLKARGEAIRSKIGEGRLVLVAASTHEGEEEAVLKAVVAARLRCPQLLLLLVPRHPQRFDQVAELIGKRSVSFVRHSEGGGCEAGTAVLLGDTMGELLYFYSASDIAFVGGSLVPVGGHNLMEAAAMGLPILMGPHRFNIEEISQVFLHEGALMEVRDDVELADLTMQLSLDEQMRAKMGAAAHDVMTRNQGALAHTLEIVERHLDLG